MDCVGPTIWIADVHRNDGKRFVVRADEKLTAFIELESAIRPRLGTRAESREERRNDQLSAVHPLSVRPALY